MTRCPMSRPKRRSQRGKGKSIGYKRGMRGHTWRKIIGGRECVKCGKKVLR